jgi:hypothetical protein
VQVVYAKVTLPVPPVWDQVTVPSGRWPLTAALQVTLVGLPATTESGRHVALVSESFRVTVKEKVPEDG